MIPLDLTHLVIANQEVQAMILNGGEREPNQTKSILAMNLRPMFHDLLLFFAETYRNVFGLREGPPLHDPVAVAAILPESVISFDDNDGEKWHVKVVTDGSHGTNPVIVGQLGRTIISKSDGSGVRIPRGLDIQCFWNLIGQALENVEKK